MRMLRLELHGEHLAKIGKQLHDAQEKDTQTLLELE
jgi:hypothetical protein